MQELRQSTAVTVPYGPFVDSTDGVTAETALTIQKAHVRVKKNGGDMAAASSDQGSADAGAPHDEIGVYDGSLNTTDTNTLGRLRLDIQKAGAAPWFADFLVVTAAEWDAKYSTGVRTADVTKWNGTAVATPATAGYPAVTVKTGTGTGELSLSSGVIKASLEQFLGTAITEGASGRVAAAFQTLFNVASPVLTAASVNQTGDTFARIGATGSGLTSLASAADLATLTTAVGVIDDFLDTEIAAIKAKTDNLPTDPADASDVAAAISSAQSAILSKLLKYFQLALRKDAAIGTDNATEKTAINADGGSGAGAWTQTTDSQEAAADRMALDSTVAKDATVALDATVAKASALATAQTSLNTIDDFLDTEIASIISALTVIDDFLDTEVAAIKAKTDNLPTDPADASDVAAAITAARDTITALLPAALVGGRMDSSIGAINASTAAAVRLALSAGVIIPGTVDTTGFAATTTQFEADDITTAAADHYNGRVIIFTSGSLIGQATSISDYSLATGRGHFTVPALTAAPADNVTFIIV